MSRSWALVAVAVLVGVVALSVGPAGADEVCSAGVVSAEAAAVQAHLVALGYSEADAQARVAAMTPEELRTLAENPGQIQAAGNGWVWAGVIIVVVLLVWWMVSTY